MNLEFKKNIKTGTLGVELEVQMIDPFTGQLVPRSEELLKAIKDPGIIKEMFLSTVEIVTGVCDTVRDVEADLLKKIEQIEKWGADQGVVFLSTGTHPMADFNDRVVHPSERYQELLDLNQWLIRRMAVYGLHVHIAMPNGDACIGALNRFLEDLPLFLALSASSPFWNGTDTGLMSVRPTMYESHPTSGLPYLTEDWADFQSYYNDLLSTRSIQSMKDIWWDLRPSPGYGTLELRMCDAPSNMEELLAIVALAQALATSYAADGYQSHLPKRWILRENKWRAIRYGLDAELIDHATMEVKPMREVLASKLIALLPWFVHHESMQCLDILNRMLEFGVSADRQKRKFIETNSLMEVISMNSQEFKNRKPN
jgi:carboxylate-amine ligase